MRVRAVLICAIMSAPCSFGQAEAPVAIIDITGRIITSDDCDAPGRLEEAYFGDEKEFSEELTGRDGVPWRIEWRREMKAGRGTYLFAVYQWEGNAAALIVHKNDNGRFIRRGGYAYIFGGNGADIRIEKIAFSHGKMEIEIFSIGFLHNGLAEKEAGYPDEVSHKIKLILYTAE